MEGKSYNTKCEIFSFGMMLWELSFEKYPYSEYGNNNDDLNKIRKHITSGKREKLIFGRAKDQKEKEIQQTLADIIRSAWLHDPNQRINLGTLLIKLEELSKKYVKPGSLPQIFPDKKLDLGGEKYSEDLEDFEEDFDDCFVINYNIKTIMPLNEGIKIHKQIKNESIETTINEKRMQAWECFVDNAEIGNSLAKYWKGYYLWEGYVQEDKKEAVRLFKEAADDGVSGAQFRYAFSIITNREKISQTEIEELIKYLTMAADNGYHVALYNLGNIYVNGQLNVEINHDLGISKLKLAAAYGNNDVKSLLNKLGY